MKIHTSYRIKICHYNRIFEDTVRIYRAAVDFFIEVLLAHPKIMDGLSGQKERVNAMECLTVATKKRPSVPHDFAAANKEFYKFPSYLRRAAIAEAIGRVSSRKGNLANWEAEDPKTRGRKPGIPKAGSASPVLYRGGMYEETFHRQLVNIKVFRSNTWDWLTIKLRKSDVGYLRRHCASRTKLSPTLQKRGKQWFLDFPFEENVELQSPDIMDCTAVCVDLGINSAATVSVMRADGTVAGRHFLRLPTEYDSLTHAIGRIKKAQRLGAKRMPCLWAKAKGINDRIAVKTAQFIMDTAVLYNADVIVFEHLELNGKKRGSKKQRLHLWRAQYVQSMVADKAHRLRIRISRVCAWNTSRLAFDGSGPVIRGRDSVKTGGCYSLCEFSMGKVYNCDLNASYNIGARYFIREILKSVPATVRLRLEANVPPVCKRSTCTLSDLISLYAETAALAAA